MSRSPFLLSLTLSALSLRTQRVPQTAPRAATIHHRLPFPILLTTTNIEPTHHYHSLLLPPVSTVVSSGHCCTIHYTLSQSHYFQNSLTEPVPRGTLSYPILPDRGDLHRPRSSFSTWSPVHNHHPVAHYRRACSNSSSSCHHLRLGCCALHALDSSLLPTSARFVSIRRHVWPLDGRGLTFFFFACSCPRLV